MATELLALLISPIEEIIGLALGIPLWIIIIVSLTLIFWKQIRILIKLGLKI